MLVVDKIQCAMRGRPVRPLPTTICGVEGNSRLGVLERSVGRHDTSVLGAFDEVSLIY